MLFQLIKNDNFDHVIHYKNEKSAIQNEQDISYTQGKFFNCISFLMYNLLFNRNDYTLQLKMRSVGFLCILKQKNVFCI